MTTRTYEAARSEIERLRGELLEEHAGHTDWSALRQWTDDPVGWDLSCGRNPVDYQREVMESVAANKLTAWRGCHGCGKEFTLGSLAVWAAYVRRMLVLVVSATERQVIGQTMREVRAAWRAAHEAHGIGGQLFQGSVRIAGEDRIVALTGSANVDALTGWHDAANGVAVLISEGQGERLEDVAYDAAFGNVTTERGRICATGNPVRPGGRYWEIHQRDHWRRFRTAASDTPNVRAGEIVRPGFPAPDWPDQVAREYGTDSPFYVARVEAEFPETATDSLVRQTWLDAAVEAHEAGTFEGDDWRHTVGVDVARGGPDATVMAIRKGAHVVGFRSWRGLDTEETADRVLKVCGHLHDAGKSPVRTVVVDATAVGGGVADKLKRTLPHLKWHESGRRGRGLRTRRPKLVEFVGGSKAKDTDRFLNLRAQAYWHLRKLLEEGKIALPNDPDLMEELRQTRWETTANGKVQIEAKEKLKARLSGSSPDKSDALSMSYVGELKSAKGYRMKFSRPLYKRRR